MKKQLLFLSIQIVFSASFTSKAQVVIDVSDLPVIGTKIVYSEIYYPGADVIPGDAGANKIWDFSFLKEKNSPRTMTFIDPKGTDGEADFPTANSAIVDGEAWGEELGIIYFEKNASSFNILGLYPDKKSVVTSLHQGAKWNVPDTLMRFPLTYKDHFGGTYYSDFTTPANDPNVDSVRTKSLRLQLDTVDAYGIIKTSLGTFDAIRIKRYETNYYDSIFHHIPGSGWKFIVRGRSSSYKYLWLVKNIPQPVLEIARIVNPPYSVYSIKWITSYSGTTAINQEPGNCNVVVYPDPTKNELNFKNLNENAHKIEITDAMGKKIIEIKICSRDMNIKTNGFSVGMYFYRITDKKGDIIAKDKFIVNK